MVLPLPSYTRTGPHHNFPGAPHHHQLGSHTTVDWCNFLRKVKYYSTQLRYVSIYNYRVCGQYIGGPGTIVETDEATLGKWKYHRGDRHWVLGGIEEGTDKIFWFLFLNVTRPPSFLLSNSMCDALHWLVEGVWLPRLVWFRTLKWRAHIWQNTYDLGKRPHITYILFNTTYLLTYLLTKCCQEDQEWQ